MILFLNAIRKDDKIFNLRNFRNFRNFRNLATSATLKPCNLATLKPARHSLHFGLRRSKKLFTPSEKSAVWRMWALASIPRRMSRSMASPW